MYTEYSEADHKHHWVLNTWYEKVIFVSGWFATAMFLIGFFTGFISAALE